MSFLKTALRGAASTAAMTLIGRWRTKGKKKQFVEPQVMGGILRGERLPDELEAEITAKDSWAMHLTSGALVGVVYNVLWKNTKLPANPLVGGALGAATGALAIAAWKRTFRKQTVSPDMDYDHFYKQLFVSHVIFGATAALGKKK